MRWVDGAYIAVALLLCGNTWFAYDRMGKAEQRADRYAVAYQQWKDYGEQEYSTATHNYAEWEKVSGRLAEVEAERDALLQEREQWVWRTLHAEARTPFDLGFLTWADSGVSWCESRNIPTRTNGKYWGLLQIDVELHLPKIQKRGYTPEDLLRPIPNLIVAHDIWREQAGTPWTCKGVK